MSGIAAAIALAADQKTSVSTEFVRADYTFDDLDSWPEPDRDPDGAVAFFEQRFGRQNATLLFHGRPGLSVVAVMIASAKPDTVVDAISEEVKEAAKQCSGTQLALVALHLIDPISPSDLQAMLTTPNGLHEITHAVLKNMNRLHVDTVAFTVPQVLADRWTRSQMAVRPHDRSLQSAAAISLHGDQVDLSRGSMTSNHPAQ